MTNSIGERSSCWKLKCQTIVAREGESDFRVTDRLQMQLMFDVAALGIFGAKKFAAGWHVVEKHTHLHFRSGRFSPLADDVGLPPVHNDFNSGNSALFARRFEQ